MNALLPAERTALLSALSTDSATVAVKGDAPGSVYQALSVCGDGETPELDGCIAVTLLDSLGAVLPPGSTPDFVQFHGVTGTFSTWAVIVPCGLGSCVEIPTVSQWGVVVMTLLLLTAGTIVYKKRCSLAA